MNCRITDGKQDLFHASTTRQLPNIYKLPKRPLDLLDHLYNGRCQTTTELKTRRGRFKISFNKDQILNAIDGHTNEDTAQLLEKKKDQNVAQLAPWK